MILFDNCTKEDLAEVVEALAYQVAQYQHPTWYGIDEDTVAEILLCEGLTEIERKGV